MKDWKKVSITVGVSAVALACSLYALRQRGACHKDGETEEESAGNITENDKTTTNDRKEELPAYLFPLKSPRTTKDHEQGLGASIQKGCYGYAHQNVQGVVYPPFIHESAVRELRSRFRSQPDDIFLCSYPTSGVTWLQQIVTMLLGADVVTHDDIGFERIDMAALQTAAPWLEASFCADATQQKNRLRSYLDWNILEASSGTTTEHLYPKEEGYLQNEEYKSEGEKGQNRRKCRVFKTHAPYQLFPCSEENLHAETKIIYIARNPKDVVCSMYERAVSTKEFEFEGDWDSFFDDMFMKGKLESGSWFDHNISWHKAFKNSVPGKRGQILNVYYEDLQSNLLGQICRIAAFLNLETDDQLLRNILHMSASSAHQKWGLDEKKIKKIEDQYLLNKQVISRKVDSPHSRESPKSPRSPSRPSSPRRSRSPRSPKESRSPRSPGSPRNPVSQVSQGNFFDKIGDRDLTMEEFLATSSVIDKASWSREQGGLVRESQSRAIDAVFRDRMPIELYAINLKFGLRRSTPTPFLNTHQWDSSASLSKLPYKQISHQKDQMHETRRADTSHSDIEPQFDSSSTFSRLPHKHFRKQHK